MVKEIKDIGVKIASKEESLWNKVKKEATILIQQSKDNLEVQEEILKLAEKKIEENKL